MGAAIIVILSQLVLKATRESCVGNANPAVDIGSSQRDVEVIVTVTRM